MVEYPESKSSHPVLKEHSIFLAGGHHAADHRVGGEGVLRRALQDAQGDPAAVGGRVHLVSPNQRQLTKRATAVFAQQ